MAWFHRSRKNIEEQNSREMPDGLWMKCSGCDHIIYKGELEEHLSTCSQCNKHFRIKANDYLNLLFDNESFIESDKDVTPGDDEFAMAGTELGRDGGHDAANFFQALQIALIGRQAQHFGAGGIFGT